MPPPPPRQGAGAAQPAPAKGDLCHKAPWQGLRWPPGDPPALTCPRALQEPAPGPAVPPAGQPPWAAATGSPERRRAGRRPRWTARTKGPTWRSSPATWSRSGVWGWRCEGGRRGGAALGLQTGSFSVSPCQQFVSQGAKPRYTWIGLTATSGNWKWVDGTRYTVRRM